MARKIDESYYEEKRFEHERGRGSLKEFISKRLREKFYPPDEVYMKMVEDRYAVGMPDCIGVVNGRCVVIELKVKKNKPTKLQEHELKMFENAGAVVGVAYTWGEFKQIIQAVRDAT